MNRQRWANPLCILCSLILAPAALAIDTDRTAILEGVHEIGVTGVPGPLCVYGDAFAVITAPCGKSPAAVVAAGKLGEGRVVAFGHNGYFGAEVMPVADTARLVANAAAWAARGAHRSGGPVIGLRGCKALEPTLRQAGAKCLIVDDGELTPHLGAVDVLILPAGEIREKDLPALETYVRRGGGILSGVPGWGFLATHPGSSLAKDLAANQLFDKAGIVWADGSMDKTDGQRYAAQGESSPLLNASTSLRAVQESAAGKAKLSSDDMKVAMAQLTRAARSLPPGDTLLLPLLEKAAAEYRTKALVSDRVDMLADNGLGKVALTFDLNRDRAIPPEQIRANPFAKSFPGAVPTDAVRVKKDVALDLSVPDWHSTGLYAAPGEMITVSVPSDMTKLKLRIGSHSDRLWHLENWQRPPEIDRVWPLAPGVNKAATSFGGLIYVVVPPGLRGEVKVTIDHAVEAPLFVLGTTDANEWKSRIRNLPGPWAEIGSDKIFLTVPSKVVRQLDDPAALMEFWNRVSDAAADLYTIPHARRRPERYVADVQISAGYMHSGYPIMTHLDAAPKMVDLATLTTKGDWGLFHELGHNHQVGDWTFAGTVEVTNNLLPLYCLENLCNHAPLHGSFTAAARAKAEAKYLAKGADFKIWQAEPFTALIMYQQLRDAFGWETYQKVFAEYRDLPLDQRPKTEQEKRDQWMVRFSRAAGKNLGPFFEHWGVPVSDAAKKAVGELPGWMPGRE